LTTTGTWDVVIVGAGVIGANIAFELAKKGYRTVNVDKLPAAGFGPTSSSCAIVRAHYSSLEGVAMAYENFFYWENWRDYLEVEPDDRGLARFVRCGTVLLKSKSGHHEKVLRHYREIGIEFEDWDTETLRRRVPYYDVRSFWPPRRPEDDEFWIEPSRELEGAIFTAGSGYVNDPQLAAYNVQRAAQAKGGEFIFNVTVSGIRRANGRVRGVSLSNGDSIEAPVVVNVAGPHSFLVNRMADVESGMNVKTRALRHEVHVVPAPAGIDFEKIGHQTSDGDQAIYFRPESGNNILVGSEDPPCDPQIWIDDPDNYDRRVTEAQWEAQTCRLARRMPGVRLPPAKRGLVDLYDVSDDWIPIYDRSDLDGFYMAVGTSGNQFKNASVVGHLMAELIDACENGRDHDADPVAVRCRYTENTLNAGFYSRRREINDDSSFSVNG
jgi:sarcosine oxidase subunit beta